MTYHHSSWHADSEAAKRALKVPNTSKKNSSTIRKVVSTDPLGESLLNLGSMSSDTEDDTNDDEDTSDNPTELESILGLANFGPVLGNESKSKQEGLSNGPRIISSNLDFLKDLGSIDGMLGLSNTNGDGSGLPPGSIIRISKFNNQGGDDDDETNEYDEDDEDNFSEADDTNNDGEKSILELLADKKREKKKKTLNNRSKCINELRRLSKDGRISPKQKRLLLTDIISCSAKGEKSLVEHAYKLLCVDATDKDAAEEEFVDQCLVFAQSFF